MLPDSLEKRIKIMSPIQKTLDCPLHSHASPFLLVYARWQRLCDSCVNRLPIRVFGEQVDKASFSQNSVGLSYNMVKGYDGFKRDEGCIAHR